MDGATRTPACQGDKGHYLNILKNLWDLIFESAWLAKRDTLHAVERFPFLLKFHVHPIISFWDRTNCCQ